MEIDLAYVDYAVVGLMSGNTLKSFQSTESKQRNKIAVADKDGVLQIFSSKNEEIQLNFKTLPGEPITALDIGISQGNFWTHSSCGCYDRIFISAGTEVRGYTKKGKLFMSLEINSSETIIAMKVFESDLLVTGEHCMTHYRDCKDIGSYICGDKIVDIAAIQLQNSNRIIGMVACQGGSVHAIERGRVLAVVKLPSSPGLLFSGCMSTTMDFIFYGAVDGSLYSLNLDREHGSIEAHAFMDIKRIKSISAAGWWDRNSSNSPLLLLGHSDGSFQIYNIKTDTGSHSSQLLFSYLFDESVSAVTGWNKGIVIATSSGRIVGLTIPMDANSTATKLNKLREEVSELESRIEKERSQYRIATQPLSQGLSAIPMLQINEKWGPLDKDGTKTLCLSLSAPIDIILIQSDALLQLSDPNPNTALLTQAIQTKGQNKLLATYRCQANTQEIIMRIGIKNEMIDSSGKICIYITPLLQPKCCQILRYRIPPLFWHTLIEEHDERMCNSLTVTGSFSRAEVHAWLCCLLPEITERIKGSDSVVVFKSIIMDTQLICSYQKGEAVFKSDNVSTISIIKDFLSTEAVKKKIQLDMTCVIKNETILDVYEKIHPQILFQYQKIKQSKIINALSELQISSDTLNKTICTDYENLLNMKKEGSEERMLQLSQLHDIIINMFVDGNKLKGYNVKNKAKELKDLLDNYNYDEIKSFIENNVN